MDFERADIKALFYDYPIEKFISVLDDEQNLKGDEYLSILPQLMRWREEGFTQTEDKLITDKLEHSWYQPEGTFGDVDFITNLYRPFLLVGQIASDLLCDHYQNGKYEPRVQFENLFRWKDVTLYVGEDLFTMAYMAMHDVNNLEFNAPFLWPDTLRHNNNDLNRILKKGMTDLHAHYNATADIFHFNWVNLMNHVRHASGVKEVDIYQDLAVQVPGITQNYTLKCICIAAAYLRKLLFEKFVLGKKDDSVSLDKFREVKRYLIDEPYVYAIQENLQNEIDALRMDGLKMLNGSALDYAIRVTNETLTNVSNINLAYNGERELLYHFFVRYFGEDDSALALTPYFYLYILLKTRVRKEIIQINKFNGFENFEIYQDRKELFINSKDALRELWGNVVLQTSTRYAHDYLEARVSPKEIWQRGHIYRHDFKQGLFDSKTKFGKVEHKLGIVVHFIKKKETKKEEDSTGNCRYYGYRKELQRYVDDIVRARIDSEIHHEVPIVGIDAAGTEMFCRPEVFAHVYRYAKRKNIYGRTYHVGEDFFDIVDGLRAIDEAIEFLELDSNSRIGHGLALSVDAKKYYDGRHHKIIMPCQNMLDCCVWLWMRCREFAIPMDGNLDSFLVSQAHYLYSKIGYAGNFDIWDYWNSMQLRGEEPGVDADATKLGSDWTGTACQTRNKLYKNERSLSLYDQYQLEPKVKKEGRERYSETWPEQIVELVCRLQQMMIRKIVQRDISIECNPTSNIKIGFFERYDEHPLLTTFYPIEHWKKPDYPLVRCSINTDDRGVFATSIYNEYSLIALALLKKRNEDKDLKYNSQEVYEYIGHIREMSEAQRFVGPDFKGQRTDSSTISHNPLIWRDSDVHIDSASKEVKKMDVNVQLGLPERGNAFVPKNNETNDVEKVDESKHVWCIDFGFEGIAWQRIWFERVDDFGSEWVIKDFVMPPSNRMFWVGPGKFQGNSEKALLCEIPIYGVNRDKNRNHQKDDSKKYQIGAGAVGTLRIFDDSTDKNWYIEFIPKCYQITYGFVDGSPWSSEDIKKYIKVDLSNPFIIQDQLWMKNDNYNPIYKYYVGIARENGTTVHVKGLSNEVN